MLKLSALRKDARLRHRTAIDPEIVAEWAELMSRVRTSRSSLRGRPDTEAVVRAARQHPNAVNLSNLEIARPLHVAEGTIRWRRTKGIFALLRRWPQGRDPRRSDVQATYEQHRQERLAPAEQGLPESAAGSHRDEGTVVSDSACADSHHRALGGWPIRPSTVPRRYRTLRPGTACRDPRNDASRQLIEPQRQCRLKRRRRPLTTCCISGLMGSTISRPQMSTKPPKWEQGTNRAYVTCLAALLLDNGHWPIYDQPTGGYYDVKSSYKTTLAIAMSTAALTTFGVLAPQVARAGYGYSQCATSEAGACGTACNDNYGNKYSCCGSYGGGFQCDCHSGPVDCSYMFS